MSARAGLAGLFALAWLAATPAHAGACCLSSSAFGIGRLALWEQFAIIVGTSASPVAGRWDERRAWHDGSTDYAETEWRAQLSALVALHERVQVYGRAPFVFTQKVAGELSESGGGLGDSQVGVRLEPLAQGQVPYVPEVSISLGATLPSGRTVAGARTPLASDVTGRGAWVLLAALTFEVAQDDWFAQLAGGLTYPLAMAGVEPGTTQQFGTGLQASLAGGYELRKGLVASLVARVAWEDNVKVDGVSLPKTAAFDFGGGPNLAWELSDHLTLQAGADFNIFRGGFGANRQGRTTVNLGCRYAYF